MPALHLAARAARRGCGPPAVVLLPSPTRPALAVAALALVIGAGIAAYHVGVEQGLFTSSCDGGRGATSIDDLRAQVMGQSGPACSQVAWSLFGISMAGWNLIASMGLAGLAVFGLVRGRRSV